MTTTIEGSQVRPGEAWKPNEETFDQFMIYGATDLHVGIQIFTDIPLSFCRPMLDMAGQYAPIILGVQLPSGTRPKDPDLRRSIFHQHIPRYDLTRLLDLIHEDEPDWIRDGDTLISGPRTEISSEAVFECAEEHCRLPDTQIPAVELPSAAHQSEPLPRQVRGNWKAAIIGGISLLVGIALGGLAF